MDPFYLSLPSLSLSRVSSSPSPTTQMATDALHSEVVETMPGRKFKPNMGLARITGVKSTGSVSTTTHTQHHKKPCEPPLSSMAVITDNNTNASTSLQQSSTNDLGSVLEEAQSLARTQSQTQSCVNPPQHNADNSNNTDKILSNTGIVSDDRLCERQDTVVQGVLGRANWVRKKIAPKISTTPRQRKRKEPPKEQEEEEEMVVVRKKNRTDNNVETDCLTAEEHTTIDGGHDGDESNDIIPNCANSNSSDPPNDTGITPDIDQVINEPSLLVASNIEVSVTVPSTMDDLSNDVNDPDCTHDTIAPSSSDGIQNTDDQSDTRSERSESVSSTTSVQLEDEPVSRKKVINWYYMYMYHCMFVTTCTCIIACS